MKQLCGVSAALQQEPLLSAAAAQLNSIVDTNNMAHPAPIHAHHSGTLNFTGQFGYHHRQPEQKE